MAQRKKAPKNVPPKANVSRRLLGTETDLEQADIDVLTAVRNYELAKQALQIFLDDNAQVMSIYQMLVAELNQKRQEADQMVRARDVSCGDWDRYTERTTYDVNALHQLLGDEKFLKIGGSIGKVNAYSIPDERIELAIQLKQIKPEQVPIFKSVIPSFHAPKDK